MWLIFLPSFSGSYYLDKVKMETQSAKFRVLIYGYGNPGRQDDGLGNAFVEKIEAWAVENNLSGFEFDSNYQLNIEDASAIADKDLVIFADASTEEIENFLLTRVDAETAVTFTTHAASPGYIVKLCEELYGKKPAVFLLHIKGYSWEFQEGLTAKAAENLTGAIAMMKIKLLDPRSMIEDHSPVNL